MRFNKKSQIYAINQNNFIFAHHTNQQQVSTFKLVSMVVNCIYSHKLQQKHFTVLVPEQYLSRCTAFITVLVTAILKITKCYPGECASYHSQAYYQPVMLSNGFS